MGVTRVRFLFQTEEFALSQSYAGIACSLAPRTAQPVVKLSVSSVPEGGAQARAPEARKRRHRQRSFPGCAARGYSNRGGGEDNWYFG
jgi:hypothetical protein